MAEVQEGTLTKRNYSLLITTKHHNIHLSFDQLLFVPVRFKQAFLNNMSRETHLKMLLISVAKK